MFSDLIVVKDGVEVRVPWSAVVDGYGGAPGLLREILSRSCADDSGSARGLVRQLQLDGAGSGSLGASEDELRCAGEHGGGFLGSTGGGYMGESSDRVEAAIGDGGARDSQVGKDELVFRLSSASGVVDGTAFQAAAGCGSVSQGKNFLRNKKKKLRDRAKRTTARVESGDDAPSVVRPGLSYASVVAGGSPAGASSQGVPSDGGSVSVVSSSAGAPAVDGGFVRGDLESVTTVDERRTLARQWYERKQSENELAIQRNRYNVKRNAYLDRSRISEKRWEQERLVCEQKLANITEARFGSKPGYAETLASLSDGSELPPSLSTGSDSPANLSDGTVSPNSSMSVAEANRLVKKVEELSGKVREMELRETAFKASSTFSGGHVEVEDGKVHIFDATGRYVPPSLSGESQPSMCPSDFM